jgi:hypothetical protein
MNSGVSGSNQKHPNEPSTVTLNWNIIQLPSGNLNAIFTNYPKASNFQFSFGNWLIGLFSRACNSREVT